MKNWGREALLRVGDIQRISDIAILWIVHGNTPISPEALYNVLAEDASTAAKVLEPLYIA